VVLGDDASKTRNAIDRRTITGERGDGKIFIMLVDNAVPVRAEEEGENAI